MSFIKPVLQILLGILLGGSAWHYLEPWLPPLPLTAPARAPDPALALLDKLANTQHTQTDLLREQLAQAQLSQIQISAQLDDLTKQLAGLTLATTPTTPSAATPTPEPPPAAGIELMDETAQRKEIAWKAFYTAPERCQNMTTPEVVVECGNHHIRKRREFEQRWEQGQMR